MRFKKIIPIIFIIPLLFGSCNTGKLNNNKNYAPNLSKKYRDQGAVEQNSNLATIQWREFFRDPVLKDLIDSALNHNIDMQLAIKNIESSELMLKQAKANQLPSLQMNLNANSTNPSQNSINGLNLGQVLGQNHVEDYTASLSLSWEADIWGKIKSQKTVALVSYLQTQEVKKAIQTRLVSQIAHGYYQLLMLQELHEIAQTNLSLSDSTLRIVQLQYEVGDINLLALEQFQAQRLAAASLIPDFERQIHLQQNAIQILSGKLPQEIKTSAELSDLKMPKEISTGIPADLLRLRPDVKQAELAITSAQAYQHYAKTKMYPSLIITAEAGVNAFKASNWFNIPASLFGAIAGSLTQPIFQRKALKTQYEQARIEQEKNVIQFKQIVITAVAEVSDALISIEKLKEKQKITQQRTSRLKEAINHANLLFETGMATYLEVITAQSNLLQSELELAQVKKAELASVVDLYRSLGGGWSN